MKTYKIIGRTNSYIAQRDIHFDGKKEIIIDSNLTLPEAQAKLLSMFNEDYDNEIGFRYKNWGLVRCHFPYQTTSFQDGTRSYEHDGRTYTIEETLCDVVFNDESDSSSKGFEMSYDECMDYIKTYNGTNKSYFADYKGGTVSIVDNEGNELYNEIIF